MHQYNIYAPLALRYLCLFIQKQMCVCVCVCACVRVCVFCSESCYEDQKKFYNLANEYFALYASVEC